MMTAAVHHIAYLVKSIAKSEPAFTALGYKRERDVFYDAERKTNFLFLFGNGMRVELVEPQEDSDIYPLLKKYKNEIYHVCYCVNDLDAAVQELQENGFLLFRDKQRARAISDTAQVVFLTHARMGIVELLQEDGDGVRT